jgi:hypothetical protein
LLPDKEVIGFFLRAYINKLAKDSNKQVPDNIVISYDLDQVTSIKSNPDRV